MTPEKYKTVIDSCKTRDELMMLIQNTMNKGRSDLASIAEEVLITRFPIRKTWKPSSGKTEVTIPFEKAKDIYKGHPALTRDEIEFLAKHMVPPSCIFNATGMSTSDYQEQMKKEDCDIAYGTVQCQKAGHRLRTRSGHCIQCKPANISYQLRHKRSGEVYIAESIEGGHIVKVGSSVSSSARISGLVSEKYAGRSDWAIKYYYGVKNMGAVEFEVHAALSEHSITNKFYFNSGHKILCREIFSCPTETAINALKAIISSKMS